MAARVTQGGHNIPEDVIRRRLAQGIRYIIIQTYLPFCLMKVKYMKTPVSHSGDPDLQKVTQALLRAGEKARQLSKQTE